MSKRVMFPRWLRWWHWINAVVFIELIVTGFSLHYADEGAGVPFRNSVIMHNALGVALIDAYLFYVLRMLVTGHYRQFMPHRGQLRDILKQTRFYLFGIFQGAHHPFVAVPERRFNPIQQLAYIALIFFLIPAQAITGIFLLYPTHAPESFLERIGGIGPVAIAHSVIAYASTAFLVVHLYLALTVAEPHTGVTAMALGDRMPPPPPPPAAR
jgi:thiosulfate reductase cytochrome b subunit